MTTISPVKIWRNQSVVRSYLGKTGTIVSFTMIYVPPAGYESQAPYPVVLVEFSNVLKKKNIRNTIVGQLVDFEPNELIIGQKVIAVLRKIKDPGKEGVIPYGVKFKPTV